MISVASFEVMKERILLMSTFMVILSTNLPLPILPFSVGGGFNLLPNFQKGRAWQDLNVERGLLEKSGVNVFRGVAI